MPRGESSSRKREAAISALLCTGTFAEAARKAKISERTLRTWLRDASFCADYRAARSRILEHSLGVMQAASISAVTCLLRNLNCGRAATEIAAAGKILEHSLGAVEMFDLVQRVTELEQTVKTQGTGYESRSTFPNGQAPRGGPGH
jgi:hypothetical protein